MLRLNGLPPFRLARGVAAAGALLAVASACDEPVTRQECDRLLDRYVELLARTNQPDASAAAVREFQTAAKDLAKRDPAFADCQKEVSRRKLECAMKAPNVDRMEICLL